MRHATLPIASNQTLHCNEHGERVDRRLADNYENRSRCDERPPNFTNLDQCRFVGSCVACAVCNKQLCSRQLIKDVRPRRLSRMPLGAVQRGATRILDT